MDVYGQELSIQEDDDVQVQGQGDTGSGRTFFIFNRTHTWRLYDVNTK